MVRVGLVGTGGIARSHAQALRAHAERTRLVAVADVDQDRARQFAEQHRVAGCYGDLETMLGAERPDLVCICTPPFLHAEQAIACLRSGAWAWCEKPLCGSLADLDRISDAEGVHGPYCSSVVQWRFGSAGRHLKALIDEEAMGRLLVGICQTTWYRDRAYYEVPWRGRWDTELGGVTMGHGIHAIDLFLWLLGDWEELSAMTGTLDREIAVEDTSLAIVRFGRGAMGSIVNSVLCPRQESYLRFDFQRGTVEARTLYGYTNGHWTYTPLPGTEESEAARWADLGVDVRASHEAQLGTLLDAMDAGRHPPAGLGEIRPTFELLSALYRSAATGRAVRRGEIAPGDPFYDHVAGMAAVG
jgi:predicted dehydrogenase